MRIETGPVAIREVGLRDGLQSIARVAAHRAEARVDPRRLRRRPARDRGRLVRSGAPAAAARRYRRAGRLRQDAARPVRVGAGAESQGRGARDRIRRRPDAAAAVGEPCAQPRQPAQDAGRRGAGDRAHPRRARRGRIEVPDRGRHQHGVRLHDPGPRRARRSAAPAAGRARRRRGSRRPRRHRRLRRSADGARRCSSRRCASPASAWPAATSTTRAASASPTCTRRGRPASAASTPASPASAAARMRPAPAATSRPRTSSTSSPAWAWPPARTSTG